MKSLNIFSLILLVNNFTLQANPISKQDLKILLQTIKTLDKSYQKQIKDNPIQFIKELKPLLEAEKNALLILVNKKIPIPREYNPTDLVYLKDFKKLKILEKKA
ncbi:D-alanyl-D-alanine metallocarboxypeptidase [Borrelia nietonii YOR]|uniref:D-alanyl-D-alanine metallocarboxypeptidase n=1 Tax=Borrelia nietonii YOR TaxID=1293576 RepID=A0ABN4C3E3_9SPIR|nr:D-alanyl-D-alanine metallocarboxypeptidase [Borrelia nietonii YOR]